MAIVTVDKRGVLEESLEEFLVTGRSETSGVEHVIDASMNSARSVSSKSSSWSSSSLRSSC